MRKEDLKKQIIDEIRKIAKAKNLNTVSKKVFKENSGISEWRLYGVFDTWNDAVQASGLIPDISTKKKSNSELFEELHRVCEVIGAIPNTMQFRKNSEFSQKVYRKNLGNKWHEVLNQFKEYLKKEHPDSKFITMMPDGLEVNKISPVLENNKNQDFVWKSKKGIVYGPPIDFRGLRHEPVNEQGVVFLFGKISEELGFSIEAVRTNYPDCDGKRLVDKNKNLWEPVLIEFEYCSSNFKEHGHDASKCDVIICWVHDWMDCPLEVIELKKIIKRLG